MNLETFSKIGSLLLGSVHDALLLESIMIFRVYSRLLDPDNTWYALNDHLCAKSLRKFGENNLFGLSPDEVRRVNIADLHDGNGGLVPQQWFNKLDGRKGSEYVYVATAFAVVAGNVGLKNTTEAEFLQLGAYVSLKSEINKHGLRVTDVDPKPATNQLCDAKKRCQSQKINVKSDQSSNSQESQRERRQANSPPRCPENTPKIAPKCSTPKR